MDLLEQLMQAGFTFRNFPTYPRHLGVEKNNCIALLELNAEGQWKQFSSPGYLLDGQIALLVEREGKPRFVYKKKQVLAEGTILENFLRFQRELRSLLEQQ
ncbi:MAG: hypothetical protein HY313_07520 [Acidobacteria bacterium]|nr:hypothetical protein [Acidobacteriota bacterium]